MIISKIQHGKSFSDLTHILIGFCILQLYTWYSIIRNNVMIANETGHNFVVYGAILTFV